MATQQAATEQESLGSLLRHPAIWRARDRHTRPACGHSSGHAVLDQQLPEQGWPRAGLVEILLDRHGIGELQLLMPLLARLSQQDERWITWVAPPYIPYAPALASQQVQLEKLLWVRTRNERETLWATHQSLSSGNCSVVLGWTGKNILAGESRRLQVSASDSDTLSILFRPRTTSNQASSAVLRLILHAAADGVRVETLKSRGSWPARPVHVPLHDAPGFQPERAGPAPTILPDPRNRKTGTQADLFRAPRPTLHVPSLPTTPTPTPMAGASSPGSAPRSRAFL